MDYTLQTWLTAASNFIACICSIIDGKWIAKMCVEIYLFKIYISMLQGIIYTAMTVHNPPQRKLE